MDIEQDILEQLKADFPDDYHTVRTEQLIVLAMGLKPSPSGETFRFYVDLDAFVSSSWEAGDCEQAGTW